MEPAAPGPGRADFLQSSAAGDRLRALPAVPLVPGSAPARVVVDVRVDEPRQRLEGIGGSLTEASAYVLARLPRERRDAILDAFFGPGGADLTMARTPIGSCDFTLAGRWSHDDVAGDTALAHFRLTRDEQDFAGAADPGDALLPLLRDALARQPGLKLVASPWTAPAWMKENRDFFTRGRQGGRLERGHYGTFARYTAAYVNACAAAGVPVWAVTPVNEPLGVGGQWESMEFSPADLRTYIAEHLGPALAPTGVRILQYDHNRGEDLVRYSRATLGDAACARFTWGTAVHWYDATNDASVASLDAVHRLAPGKPILHTEGCIDGIGSPDNSPGGRFLGWRDDGWWWRREATDWGWYWAPEPDRKRHPRYAPVHRYARDLIDGMNHWLAGWIDWNLVLDSHGGPNHAGNRCAAPVMVDSAGGEAYFTPLYDTVAHFSRYLRPGDRVVRSAVRAQGLGPDDFHALAVRDSAGGHLVVVALNTRDGPVDYDIRVGRRHAAVTIPGNALQTLRFALSPRGGTPPGR